MGLLAPQFLGKLMDSSYWGLRCAKLLPCGAKPPDFVAWPHHRDINAHVINMNYLMFALSTLHMVSWLGKPRSSSSALLAKFFSGSHLFQPDVRAQSNLETWKFVEAAATPTPSREVHSLTRTSGLLNSTCRLHRKRAIAEQALLLAAPITPGIPQSLL